jgi:hypothetical protein
MTVLAVSGGTRAFRRARGRWTARKVERASGPAAAARDAAHAVESGDHGAAASAVERAIYLTIERQTGLKARGILRENLAEVLGSQGVVTEDAEEVVRLLSDCDRMRFGRLAAEDLRDLVPRATRIVEALGQRRDGKATRGRR